MAHNCGNVQVQGQACNGVVTGHLTALIAQFSMHPPLHISKHPICREQIEALQECHQSHAYSKFWGKCNQQKWDLDACLRKEKSINRAANFAKSVEERARLQRKLGSKRTAE